MAEEIQVLVDDTQEDVSIYIDNNPASGGGVQSVTGDGVDNTDPLNPVISFAPSIQFIKTGNYTLSPDENNATVSMDGGVCTINPNTQAYQNGYIVAQKNITDSTDGSIVCTAKSGWTYKVNDAASVASGTFVFPAGATCTIIKFEGTNKIYIDGGIE